MKRWTIIEPDEIIRAFSEARIYVSMNEGPQGNLDSHGIPYRTMLLPVRRIIGASDQLFVSSTKTLFFAQLMQFVAPDGGDILVEWCGWPEIEIENTGGRVYARLTSRPKMTN